ncbi:MAG TPA: hypothetical protein VGX91_04800 [Candidatus Cybelea sp.]|jgi:ATP phosphoribosyltransferase|nr:hypothetical protein [Candidatus Cybelea sp.]
MNATVASDNTTVLLPKNRGLAAQLSHVLDAKAWERCAPRAVKGEDVPYLANELARAGRRVLAFTGEDLVEEWLAAGNALDLRLSRSRMLWRDPQAIYGAPALCLIGSPAGDLAAGETDDAEPVRIAVCARYRRLAERFLTQWTARPYELVPIAGSVETVLLSGVAELMIDIVVTGRTLREAGLSVLRVISTSDLAVLETRW